MASVAFTASEYQADGTIRRTRLALAGGVDAGWEVVREGALALRLGAGYRLLRTSHCGVCATDLARRHLPFRLPQVTGHEVVAADDDGAAVVVEINASHAARRVATGCAWCAAGMGTHCPERLVLGIHDLPGGFGPWILAPVDAVLRVPAAIDALTATFAEPFAAALHAARVATRVPRRRIAVLGPRRLGMLVVAALAAWRRRTGDGFEILALARRGALRDLARALGADDARDPDAVAAPAADVVVDTTGSPEGLVRALALAAHEVHLKTTCGAPSGGLAHATAMVVDELALARPDAHPLAPPAGGPPYATAAVLGSAPAALVAGLAARGLDVVDAAAAARLPLGGADVVVAGSVAEVDAAIRPAAGVERGIVRPRGTILLAPGAGNGAVAAAVRERGLVVSTSRCGDLRAALELLPDVPGLAARLVTAVHPADRLADAFAAAASPTELKVVVTQPDAAF